LQTARIVERNLARKKGFRGERIFTDGPSTFARRKALIEGKIEGEKMLQ